MAQPDNPNFNPNSSHIQLRAQTPKSDMTVPKLQAAVVLMVIFISHATQTSPISMSLRLMGQKSERLLKYLNDHKVCLGSEGHQDVGRIHKPKEENLTCHQMYTFHHYFNESIILAIEPDLTEGLNALKQQIETFQSTMCSPKANATSYKSAFEESDGDHEKVCKVKSLLDLFTQWMERPLKL